MDPIISSSDVVANDRGVCRGCGHAQIEAHCPVCGLLPDHGEALGPQVGDRLALGAHRVLLRAVLSVATGTRFLATSDDGGRFELLLCREDDDAELVRRVEARAVFGDDCLAPVAVGPHAGGRFALFAVPDVPSLALGLGGLAVTRQDMDPVSLVRRWVLPVVRWLAGLHAKGLFLGDCDPAEILVADSGRCLLRAPPTPRSVYGAPLTSGVRLTPVGFSAPEVFGRCGGRVDTRTDVFFAGMALYYVLTCTTPIREAGLTTRLPQPQTYRDGIPPDLVAVVRRATSPYPARRYEDARALLRALEMAIETVAARAQAPHRRMALDLGHELHIGVLKGHYTPQNQDDLFLGYDASRGIGLFVVTDGVSISDHGSGDLASSCVRYEAARLWQRIIGGELASTSSAAGRSALPEGVEGRRVMVRGMLDEANAQIARLVHQEQPRFLGPPEGIMAATAVTAVLDGNHVELGSIGDSRIYLVRGDHIVSLINEHSLANRLIRMGRSPQAAQAAPSSHALVRCVGEFDKDSDDRLQPVPLRPEFISLSLLPGDVLVLCSDGIPDYAAHDDEGTERVILETVRRTPGAAWTAFELMVAANRGGGGDNISCIVLRFGQALERL